MKKKTDLLRHLALQAVQWLSGMSAKTRNSEVWLFYKTRLLLKPVWLPVTAWYNNCSHYQQHFIFCFALGVIIEILVHFLHAYPPVSDWQRWTRDKTIALTQMYQTKGYIKRPALPAGLSGFVWINIDEETWQNQQWGGGEPFPQPRAQIFQLIDKAFTNGSCVVYVDVFMDGASKEGDSSWLQSLAKKSISADTACPKRYLFVARSVRTILNGNGQQLRPSFWDSYVPLAPNAISVVSVVPYFPISSDLRIRQWVIGQNLLTPDGNSLHFYPSPQLALYCLQRHWSKGQVFQQLEGDCEQSALGIAQHEPAKKHNKGEIQSHAPHSDLSSMILFPFPSKVSHLDCSFGCNYGYVEYPALVFLNAVDAVQEFKGAIAVIGASFAESADFHHTPVGRIPGVLLNVNAMDTMLRHGQLHELPSAIKWPLALLLIAIVAAIFAFGQRFLAVILSSVLVFGVFAFLLGPWLLLHGMWFDFGAPLFGIQLHRMYEEFAERRKFKRTSHS